MNLTQLILVVVFVVAALVGYKIINRVPSMLHTPLMSGMNAFSGITITGCLIVTAFAVGLGSKTLGVIAIILAMINITGGFVVTHRMLAMFRTDKDK